MRLNNRNELTKLQRCALPEGQRGALAPVTRRVTRRETRRFGGGIRAFPATPGLFQVNSIDQLMKIGKQKTPARKAIPGFIASARHGGDGCARSTLAKYISCTGNTN